MKINHSSVYLFLIHVVCLLFGKTNGEIIAETPKEIFEKLLTDVAALNRTSMDQAKEIKELQSKLASSNQQISALTAKTTDSSGSKNAKNEKPNIATFYAQRDDNFRAEKSYVSYTYVRENVNHCFDNSTGLFTAPVKGVYFFFFSCVKMKAADHGANSVLIDIGDYAKLTVTMRKIDNATTTAAVVAMGHVNSYDRYGWFPLTLQATVSLEVGERVGIFLEEGFLYSQNAGENLDKSTKPGLTSFTGFFLHY